MSLHGHVYTAPVGVRGFDANEKVTASAAGAFFSHGYRFCIRYVRREDKHDKDLAPDEAAAILESGLGLMPVQHVESESEWTPSGQKGVTQGRVAVEEMDRVGIPPGVTVWCDLEGVALGTATQEIVDYCNNWHSEVARAGYLPGLYVGWRSGLTPTQLYRSLRYVHYWGAYNLNSDQAPAVRGLQMKQAERRGVDVVPPFKLDFQTDVIRTDGLNGHPTLIGPEGWLASVFG